MPYNLRKRKVVESQPEPEPVAKRPKKKQKEEPPPPKPEITKQTKKEKKEESPPPASEPTKQPKKRAKKEKSPSPAPELAPEPKKKTKKKERSPSPVSEEPPVTVKTTENQLVFGTDCCGELGLKKIGIACKVPRPVSITNIKSVACGPMHTLSLTDDGQVYTYGCNDEGALGRVTDGDEELEATPTIVPVDGKIIKVTAGDSHSVALTEDNKVFIWGNFRDEHGSVGLTPSCDGKASFNPINILPDVKFTDIASGSNHILLLDVEGTVYSFGVGAQGQLGRLKAEMIGSGNDTVRITAENRQIFLEPLPVCMKNVDPQRTFVCDAIYAGNFSSFATNTDKKKNRLAGWGLNNYYQLGYKGQKDQIVQHEPRRSTFTCSTCIIDVACGQHHTLFLTRTGRVYAAGKHNYGMLGLGKVSKEVCPAKNLESLGNDIIQVSAGINTSFAVNKEGKLYSWGMKELSLGIEGDGDLNVPTEVKTLKDHHVTYVSTGGSSFTAVLVQ